jgi:hypothetical protein
MSVGTNVGDNSTRKNIKIWIADSSSSAGMMITPEAAFLVGSRTNFVAVNNTGISLMGKSISFGVPSENQRHGGMFIKMNDFTKMIPTTLATPMPDQIPWPPLGMVDKILKDLPFFMAMLS